MPMIGWPEMLFGLVLWIVPVVLAAWLSARKGYHPAVWTILALFFTYIILIVVLVLPSRTQTA